ncbi:transposase [Halomonas alkalicola]|uniref:Transposase n=1 Tax=Halomonas alkalicola TaxID=1930622 RepID=A0ABY9H4M1_9GAMM|nr:transposase [Halomonas alkalicola]WLI73416.1 transposase [Halomonas alkalicola]
MPRPTRILLPSIPVHLVQRGNNRGTCFHFRSDAERFLDLLDEARREYRVDVHAYVLMTNHFHLLATPRDDPQGVSLLMKSLGQRYAQYFNRRHERTGGLFEGRYYSCLIGEEDYLFACYRYIELNPVRAGMVAHPGDYRWSSYPANALGAEDPRVTPHALYLASARDPEQRRRRHHYRQLFDAPLPDATLEEIRQQTRRGHAFGSEAWRERLSGQSP